jgi:tetratricopeptide (TPR) repeat protein
LQPAWFNSRLFFNFDSYNSKKMPDRIEKIKAFLKDSPRDCFLNHAMALEYVKMGDEENARKYFEINLANEAEYVATYYHLGKLLERTGAQKAAIDIYERGMAAAKAAKDMHSYSELQNAKEELEDQ